MSGASRRPNILFIFTDHQAFYRHDRRGEFEYRPPRFEAFAAEGARFDRAYSVCPICTPARASAMTGQYPYAHGLVRNTDNRSNPQEFRSGQQLYSHYLARAGYRNAYVGKWHCGHDRLPIDYGIEGWALPDYGQPYMSDAYKAHAAERGLGDARARIEHCVNRPELEGTTQVLHSKIPWTFMNASGVLEGPAEAHEEQFVAHLAVEKLRELAAAGQPWSLVASFWGPHQPYYPTEPFASMVDPASIPEYPSFCDEELAGRPFRHVCHRDFAHAGAKRWTDWSVWQEVLARAYGQGHQLDAAVGSILDALDDTGQADNTLVIWCADHGDALASHGGLFDKGNTCIEEVMRVPMAVRWPGGIDAGRRTDRLVSNMDVTATMLDAAGVDVPADMDSRSLLPLARGDEGGWPDEVICEHHGHGPPQVIQRVVITDRHKYVAALLDGDELYDLVDDPFEMSNLIDSPDHAGLRDDLRRRILNSLEGTTYGPHRLLAHQVSIGR